MGGPAGMPSPVGALFLDVGGVFHLPRLEGVEEALTGLAEVDMYQLSYAHHVAMRAFDEDPGGIQEAYAAYIVAFVGAVGVSAEDRRAATEAMREIFRGPAAWSTSITSSAMALPRLSGTGVPLVIVSNADGTLEERLRVEGLCQVGEGPGVAMTAILDSTAVGTAKPDPDIFHMALAAARVGAPAALHVGDSVRLDVQGARAAGVTPVHLDPHGLCPHRDHEHVEALLEVERFLG